MSIDWNLTKEKFGITTIDGYRPKIVIKCDGCGSTRDYTIRVKSKITDGNINWECHKCVGSRDDVKNKLRILAKDNWENESYRADRSDCSRKLWNDSDYKIKHSNSVKSSESRNKCSEAATKAWNDKSDNQKELISEAARERSIELWKNDDFKSKVAFANQNKTSHISSIQKTLYSILDDFDIKYVIEHNIGPYNFDCYLVDYKILVECQGDYWHSLKNNALRDIKKSSYIKNNFIDIQLKCVWEHEFFCKGRIENLIRYWTGSEIILHDFCFNDVDIKVIDNKSALKFLGNYHYSGSTGNSKIRYGAFIGHELIAVCCLGPITRKESATRLSLKTNEILELTRFCIHPSYKKKNFASWFIGKSIKLIKLLNKYKCIISFADETYNHTGTIYKSSNFIFDGYVSPSYWYVDSDGWVMHKKTLYNHAKSLNMTESEFAIKNEYMKVFSKRKHRYLYWLCSSGKYKT